MMDFILDDIYLKYIYMLECFAEYKKRMFFFNMSITNLSTSVVQCNL